MGLTLDPGSISKQDLVDSDFGGPGEEEITPAALQQIVEEQIIGDGTIGIINSINNLSSNGFYESPDFVVLYDYSDSTVENLADSDVAIVVETYPYISTYDDQNEFIELFGTMSDFDEPVVTEGDFFNDAGNPVEYTASYSSNEISGLKERFGFTNTFSESIYSSVIGSLAEEVVQSSAMRRFIFTQIKPERLSQNNFSSMSTTKSLTTIFTSSAGVSATAGTTQTGY
tara:strand:- start:1631 stop:2314 length:684 start_codon:yes stop_codon:yes gene_type:complete